jgi:AraC-like DNA-binding protein
MPDQEDSARFVRSPHLPGVELVAAAYRSRVFPLHSHADTVVGAVISGAELLQAGRREHLVASGDVLHLHPDEAHANRTVGDGVLRYLVFYLDAASLAGCGVERLAFASAAGRDPALAQEIRRAHRIIRDPTSDRLTAESALADLVGALHARSVPAIARPDPRSASLARDWIETHLGEGFGLADVAEAAGLSPFRLAHVFKARFGLSPIAWRNQRRVLAARDLLRAGQPIAEVAQELGFADQAHFTRLFQRVIGTSPGRYMRK